VARTRFGIKNTEGDATIRRNMLRALSLMSWENTFEDWERYYINGGR